MGLTKRLDYNGRLVELGEKLNPNFTGGPAIATRKLNLIGSDETFTIQNDVPAISQINLVHPMPYPMTPIIPITTFGAGLPSCQPDKTNAFIMRSVKKETISC